MFKFGSAAIYYLERFCVSKVKETTKKHQIVQTVRSLTFTVLPFLNQISKVRPWLSARNQGFIFCDRVEESSIYIREQPVCRPQRCPSMTSSCLNQNWTHSDETSAGAHSLLQTLVDGVCLFEAGCSESAAPACGSTLGIKPPLSGGNIWSEL